MTSIGMPQLAPRASRKLRALAAWRRALVPTARTLPAGQVREALTEAPQHAQRLLLDLGAQPLLLVESRREHDALAQPVEHVRLAPRHARHDHVEAVAAQVDRGHHVGARRGARGGRGGRDRASAGAPRTPRGSCASCGRTDGPASTAGHGARRW
jgi:hypothetical protein